MLITLLTYGSRGDIQPFIALAGGLQKAGHSIRLAGPGRFAAFAAGHGIPFVPLAGDPAEISARFNDAGTSPLRMVRGIADYVFSIAPQVARQAREACAGSSLVVHSFLFTTGGHTFARELGIPDVSVQTFPMFAPTRAFPNVSMAGIPPGLPSYLSHWLATQVFWHGGMSGYRRLRRAYPRDLPRKLTWPFREVDGRPASPLLVAVSPAVLPRPADWTSPHIHLPGYLFLDEPDYAPPPALAEFLVAGAAPVCVSFGSMVNRDAERIGRAVLAALRRTGRRAIILTGWGGWTPERLPENILALEAAAHDWLLPRCAAVIHHGGAGTTAAGLRAGIPNVVVPFAGDQPFWAKRVAALGAGPDPVPVKRLDADNLTAALSRALDDGSILSRAADLGECIRAEDGVGVAVRLIEKWADGFRRGSL